MLFLRFHHVVCVMGVFSARNRVTIAAASCVSASKLSATGPNGSFTERSEAQTQTPSREFSLRFILPNLLCQSVMQEDSGYALAPAVRSKHTDCSASCCSRCDVVSVTCANPGLVCIFYFVMKLLYFDLPFNWRPASVFLLFLTCQQQAAELTRSLLLSKFRQELRLPRPPTSRLEPKRCVQDTENIIRMMAVQRLVPKAPASCGWLGF